MVTAAFVAPYLLDTTTRFVEAAAMLPGVSMALVTCEPADRLPRATLIADGMVIIRHPELPAALEMAHRFAAELRLYAA